MQAASAFLATRRRYDARVGRDVVKLLPNEYYVTDEDVVLGTVLGSCVAACIRDSHTGLGGMNHFMLPGSYSSARAEASMRYGAYAMEVLINEILKAGGRRERLEAKVFGGGAVMDQIRMLDIGRRNAEFVLQYLALERIPVMAQDLCGYSARRVRYYPRSGVALVRKLRSARSADVLNRREQKLQSAMNESAAAPLFEMFDRSITAEAIAK